MNASAPMTYEHCERYFQEKVEAAWWLYQKAFDVRKETFLVEAGQTLDDAAKIARDIAGHIKSGAFPYNGSIYSYWDAAANMYLMLAENWRQKGSTEMWPAAAADASEVAQS